MFGIVGAMDEEISFFKTNLTNGSFKKIANIGFFSGQIGKTGVVVAKCGVGKVNAAMCAQLLVDFFKCSKLIVCGVAGSLSDKLVQKSIIVSSSCVQHDMNAQGLGFRQGQIPFTNKIFFNADKSLAKNAFLAGKKLGLPVFLGVIASGDIFLQDKKMAKKILKKFKAVAVDMEAGAIAQVCYYNRVPFVVIKAISDNADKKSSENFEIFLKTSAKNSFCVVKELLEKL